MEAGSHCADLVRGFVFVDRFAQFASGSLGALCLSGEGLDQLALIFQSGESELIVKLDVNRRSQ